VYIGDTIYAESLCTAKRTSGSRPGMGILTMITRGLNQDGDEIVSWSRSVMIPQRSSGIGQGYFPEAKSGPLSIDDSDQRTESHP
jgi:itaconyl-CoA hydratase